VIPFASAWIAEVDGGLLIRTATDDGAWLWLTDGESSRALLGQATAMLRRPPR
jgi:hypothetical protein